MSRLRVVVAGCGNRVVPRDPATCQWRGWFAEASAHPDFEVVGVADPDPAARARGAAAGIPVERLFPDVAAALARTYPDAVLVVSTQETHAEVMRLSLEAGAHVLCEKPFVSRLEDAAGVLAFARRTGRIVGAVQNWRWKAVGQALRRSIVSGGIGRLGLVLFRYVRDREAPGLPAYLFRERAPILFAMSVHHLDLVRYALGTTYVAAEARGHVPSYSRYESPPTISCVLETACGVPVFYVGTIASRGPHRPQESWTFEGETGSLTNDSDWLEPPLLLARRGAAPEDLTPGIPREIRAEYVRADGCILTDFAEAVRVGRPTACPASDALRSLAAVEAAARAIESGRRVEVAEVLRGAGLEPLLD